MQCSDVLYRDSTWMAALYNKPAGTPSCNDLYEDLKRAIRGAISKAGSGWARDRPRTASKLQKNLSQLLHWGSDIRSTTNFTLAKIVIEDTIVAKTIRAHLGFAIEYVSQLQQLCENATKYKLDDEIEAALLDSIHISIKGLQQQVDPIRAIVDAPEEIWTRNTVLSTDSDLPLDAHSIFSRQSTHTSTLGLSSSVEKLDERLDFSQIRSATTQQTTEHDFETTLKGKLEDPETDVRVLFEAACSQNFEGRTFYPSESCRKIMTKQRTRFWLRREYPDIKMHMFNDLAAKVTTHFIKVFSILLILEQGHWIAKFVENDLNDEKLPVPCDNNGDTPALKFLKPVNAQGFLDLQWEFLPPILDYRRFEWFRLDERVPLPWYNATECTDEAARRGPGGTVRRFRIDPSSHNLDSTTAVSLAV
jgi:hypothetical protein